jgi:hypothetical protein
MSTLALVQEVIAGWYPDAPDAVVCDLAEVIAPTVGPSVCAPRTPRGAAEEAAWFKEFSGEPPEGIDRVDTVEDARSSWEGEAERRADGWWFTLVSCDGGLGTFEDSDLAHVGAWCQEWKWSLAGD